jgi:hypothetical protein
MPVERPIRLMDEWLVFSVFGWAVGGVVYDFDNVSVRDRLQDAWIWIRGGRRFCGIL